MKREILSKCHSVHLVARNCTLPSVPIGPTSSVPGSCQGVRGRVYDWCHVLE